MTHDIGKEQPHSTISAKINKNEHASVVTGDANTDVVNSTTSELQTILAILKGNIGSGCLALPWAFSILGIPLGCLITFILTFLVGYNSWSLVLLKRKIWGLQRGITYSDVGERAFGKDFRVVVDVSVILLQMAICTVYFSNIGENLSSVFRQIMNPPSYDDGGGGGGGGGSSSGDGVGFDKEKDHTHHKINETKPQQHHNDHDRGEIAYHRQPHDRGHHYHHHRAPHLGIRISGDGQDHHTTEPITVSFSADTA
eukprot:CAMPEP_0198250974 /NCGR_PEP_ID=MMETSP1447-20131203/1966_1 /TAXON_ID=420782 /ORGANISM="Chaetoceros dichaeta, Strain CCMP1751" /LENGTH=254 /DNA_ID=CAMNT_0043935899 /DNA_START=159 /DNA_END=923 /DNA_ORIENTATION=+